MNRLHIDPFNSQIHHEIPSPASDDSRQSSGSQSFTCEYYNPILTANENPLYYESNRILFEAHLSRKERQSCNMNSILEKG